jgi:hypothetical protein
MKHNYPAKRRISKSRINLYLDILNSIKETGGLPKNLMSNSLLKFYVSRLKREGSIHKIGYGVWEVSEADLNKDKLIQIPPKVTNHHLPPPTVKSDDSRVHNLMFKLKVESPLSWEARLNVKGLAFERKRPGYLRLVFDGFKVWFCKDKVIVYFPPGLDFRASSVPVSLRLAVKFFFSLVLRLEAYLGFSLRSASGSLVWSMNRKHIGLVKNSLAQLYAKEGKKLNFYDDRGLWLVADDSYNLNELEFPRSFTNDLEASTFQVFFTDLRDHPVKLSEVVQAIAMLTVNGTQNTKAVKDMIELIRALNDRVDRL